MTRTLLDNASGRGSDRARTKATAAFTQEPVVRNAVAQSILRLQRSVGNHVLQRLLVRDGRGGGDGDEEVEDRRSFLTSVRRDGDGTTPAESPQSGGSLTDTRRARPINVRNGPRHTPINTAVKAGMSIAITISSSTGVDADMTAIQDSEKVSLSKNHIGSMSGGAALPSSTSSFMPGYPIPDDQHAISKAFVIDRADNHGGNGGFEKDQLDVFTDAAGGVTSPTAIPASGYIIKRSWTKAGTKITLRTEKHAASVAVDGFSSGAGPSPTQAEDVEVRP